MADHLCFAWKSMIQHDFAVSFSLCHLWQRMQIEEMNHLSHAEADSHAQRISIQLHECQFSPQDLHVQAGWWRSPWEQNHDLDHCWRDHRDHSME